MMPRRERIFGTCAALGLAVLLGAAPAWATPQVVGRYDGWIAMRDDTTQPRLCFLAVPPSVSVPSVPGRGRAALVVQHQAGQQDTVMLLTGLKTEGMQVEVSIDGATVPFAQTANGLVATDAAHTLAALEIGGTLALRLTDRGQAVLEDHYPLAGFRQGSRESDAGCDGGAVAQAPAPPAPTPSPAMPSVMGPGSGYAGSGEGRHEVQLHRAHGVTTLPVLIDGGTHVEFILDSGAASVVIPEDVFDRMQANGASPPVIGQMNAKLADGRVVQDRLIRLASVQVGSVTVSNVICAIAPRGSPALLGQTVLQRFPNWSVNNQRGVFSWQ